MSDILYRLMTAADLDRLGEIDRTERVTHIAVQHGGALEEEAAPFDIPPWAAEGDHGHTLARQRGGCEQLLVSGGTAFGAFDGERLVGIGIVLPHLRPGIAQLAFLHVSNGYRDKGIGRRLTGMMEALAVERGDREMVVSSTPSTHTVRFYQGCGYAPMAAPLPELFALEPEDVHLSKRLS